MCIRDRKKEDGYHFDPETTVGIYFGELQQPYESERVKAGDDIFENTGLHWIITVSYTHLDVYKRQLLPAIHLDLLL